MLHSYWHEAAILKGLFANVFPHPFSGIIFYHKRFTCLIMTPSIILATDLCKVKNHNAGGREETLATICLDKLTEI